MRHRYITFALFLLAGVLQMSAQALTERYNSQRPVVIVCDNCHPPFSYINDNNEPSGCCVAIMKAVAEKLDLPCKIVMKNMTEARQTFEHGDADIILTDGRSYNTSAYFVSKNVINYLYASEDSIAETRFIGKDHQLVEQLDDEFARMKETGDIHFIQEHWTHPERAIPEATPTALYIAFGLLILAIILLTLTLLLLLFFRQTRRNVTVLNGMISQAPLMEHFYDVEDNQAAHDLIHKYDAVLCNPYVAISFYDNNGHLIVENEAMKQLGDKDMTSYRQPLYNAEGEVANYFVAIRPATT